MNRYVIEGAVRDASLGSKVMIITAMTRTAREHFTRAVEVLKRGDVDANGEVSAANGREEISFPGGGRLVFRAVVTGGHRGHKADTVVLDAADLLAGPAGCIGDALLVALPNGEVIEA